MTFKESTEEILLVVDLMTFFWVLGLWLYGALSVAFLFVWIFTFIITRYLAMRGWKRCINTLKEIIIIAHLQILRNNFFRELEEIRASYNGWEAKKYD